MPDAATPEPPSATATERRAADQRPFERADSVGSRIVSSFVIVPLLLLAWPHARDAGHGTLFWWMLGVSFTLSALGTLVPWRHLPRWTESLPPLVSTITMALVVAALGGTESGFAVLLPLTVLWLAIYASAAELVIGLVLLAAMLLTPLQHWLVPSLPMHPPLDEGLVWLVVTAIVTAFVHRLVRSHQCEAAAAADAHAELELSHLAMAHDLKGPLGVLAATAEGGAAIVGVDDEGVVAHFELLGHGLRQMEQLVDDVLLLRGALGPEDLALLDPAALVLLAAGQVPAVRVTSVDLPDHVYGNEAATVRALRNVLENAARHAGDGSGAPVDVRVVGRTTSTGTRLDVEDDGPGVPDAELERIFERFRRVGPGPGAARHGAGGAGLGLAIVRACAEAQGATVHAERADGGGLRISFCFAPAPTRAGAASTATSPGDGDGDTDDSDVRIL